MLFFVRLVLLIVLSACTCRSIEYRNFYAHLREPRSHWQKMEPSDYFLVILVDARHLDYTEGWKFLHSVAKHPSDCSKNGDVGHAWIYLQGKRNGKIVSIEGGHSGEKEDPPARYFDGLMNYHQWGYANPTPTQRKSPRYEPNPIKYLWTQREDGFFQKGSGGHYPTFAAKVSLTPEQFEQILLFIHPTRYPYKHYALIGPHCTSFVTDVAQIAGLSLPSQEEMKVPSTVLFGNCLIRLWEDPDYSTFVFPTPDVLEKSLIDAVKKGEAEDALQWYLNKSKTQKTRF